MSIFTINNLISDVKTALQSGAYFSALSLTFAIISECANVEYPDKWFEKNADTDTYLREHFPNHYNKNGKYNCSNHDRERFQMWIDDWENDHNCDEPLKLQMKDYVKWNEENRKSSNGLLPKENGELLYQLRCMLFHEASSDIEFYNSKKISDIGNSKISSELFVLVLEDNNPLNLHSRGSYSTSSAGNSSMVINVNGLIYHYLSLVESYIKSNKDKKFSTIRIQDNRKGE